MCGSTIICISNRIRADFCTPSRLKLLAGVFSALGWIGNDLAWLRADGRCAVCTGQTTTPPTSPPSKPRPSSPPELHNWPLRLHLHVADRCPDVMATAALTTNGCLADRPFLLPLIYFCLINMQMCCKPRVIKCAFASSCVFQVDSF